MILSDVYVQLNSSYKRMDPHHETWELWIKGKKSELERFEVAIGTILVQNTNWKNVEKAILNLKKSNILSYSRLQSLKLEELQELIRPAGFYKQKAGYLVSLAKLLENKTKKPTRVELLKSKGIGKETADSILNYCFQEAVAIVGTYTRRFLARYYGDISYLNAKYEVIQKEIQDNLEGNFEVLGRFHALIVCHCQNICQKNKPNCTSCKFRDNCRYSLISERGSEIAEIQKEISGVPKRK
ncbi:MAG: endonuclease [Candidatus Hodarchaeales archaeon]